MHLFLHSAASPERLCLNRDVGDIAAEHRQGTQVLLDMCIWQEVKDHQGNTAIRLSSTFRENLKVAMLGG